MNSQSIYILQVDRLKQLVWLKLSTIFKDPSSLGMFITIFSYGLLLLFSTTSGVISARLLGMSGRGELAAVQSWPMLFASFGHLGIPDAVVYYIARNRSEVSAYFSYAFLFILITSTITSVCLFFALPILLKEQSVVVVSTARLFTLYVPLWMIASLVWSTFQGMQRYIFWNLLRLSPSFALCLANLIVLWIFPAEASVTLLINLLLLILGIIVLVSLLFAVNMVGLKSWFHLPDRQNLLSYGLLSVASNGPRQLNLRLDQGLLATIVSPAELGLYAVGASWAYMGFTIVIALGSASIAKIATLTNDNNKRKYCFQIMKTTLLWASVIASLMYWLTPQGLQFLFSAEYLSAINVTRLLVIAAFISTLNGVWGDLLRGLGSPISTLIAEGSGFVVTLFGLLIFLPTGGIYAAAIVSIASYSIIQLIGTMFIIQKTGH